MSYANGQYILDQDIVTMSKKYLYGLNNKPNICNLLNRQMIIRALEYNTIHGTLTASQVQFMEDALMSPSTCKTCNQ